MKEIDREECNSIYMQHTNLYTINSGILSYTDHKQVMEC